MKKILSSFLLFVIIFSNSFSTVQAVPTDGKASPWTREKAAHLARSVLFHANPDIITNLHNAGTAEAAINILFPSISGPDRSGYNAYITNYTSSGFNW